MLLEGKCVFNNEELLGKKQPIIKMSLRLIINQSIQTKNSISFS